jgi:hypothetical protein
MNDEKIITIPCTLDRYNRKKDRSVTLSFTSLLEISNEDFSIIDTFHQQSGNLLFRRNAFTNEDIPQEDVETDVAKSQSTQIRDALWVLYRAKGHNAGDKDAWNIFYRKQNQAYKARILEEVHKLEEEV